MNKEQLEKRIKELDLLIDESKNGFANFNAEQERLKIQLRDVNKPIISEEIADLINDKIDYAIEQYNFSDDGNYTTEFEISYDNRIELSHIDLDNYADLIREVTDAVMEVFKIDEDEHTDSE